MDAAIPMERFAACWGLCRRIPDLFMKQELCPNRNNSQVERTVRNVCVNMKAEGFLVSDETRKACYAIASGSCSADELVKACINAYKKTEE